MSQENDKMSTRTRETFLPLSTYAHLLFLEFNPYGRWEDLTGEAERRCDRVGG